MDIREIQFALSLPEELLRLKIVLLDNLLELFLFDVLRENAFDEWYRVDGDSTPKNRIALFRSFCDKLMYSVSKGIFDKDTSLFLNVFHEIRNQAYHQAFENITSSSSSAHYNERNHLEYHGQMSKVYDELTRLYAIVILEIFRSFLSDNDWYQFNLFISTNQHLKKDIQANLAENLSYRIKKVKDDLAYIADYSDEYNGKDEFHEYQYILNHITFNYGHEIVEKAQLDHKTKLKFLKILHQSPDYIDAISVDDQDFLFTTAEILGWENEISSIRNAVSYFITVNNWYTVHKKLRILEEIIEYHIFIAC